jgi:hypothetical protein
MSGTEAMHPLKPIPMTRWQRLVYNWGRFCIQVKYFRLGLYLRQCWYRYRHGIKLGLYGSLIPEVGKGPYVSVYNRGGLIDIVEEHRKEMIRLIPCKSNHGVMVEFHNAQGQVNARLTCDFYAFKQYLDLGGERPNKKSALQRF